MRYFYVPNNPDGSNFGDLLLCDHPVYFRATLYKRGRKGLAVIRQYFNPVTKTTFWRELDNDLASDIYLSDGFETLFENRSGHCVNGVYPTVSVRQAMWALRMKPLRKQRWETVFDRKEI